MPGGTANGSGEPRSTPRFALWLATIASMGVAVRVALTVALVGGQLGFGGDIRWYHWSANDISQGFGYIAPYQHQHGLIRATAEHPPLWPHLLSAASRLGVSSVLGHRLVGCALGGAVIVMIGLLGRRIGGDRLGLVSAGVAASYPVLIGADGSLMSETLFGLGIVTMLLLAYIMSDGVRPGHAVLAGLLCGVTALVRPEALLYLPLLFLPILVGHRRRFALHVLLIAGAAAAVVLPWSYRNWQVFDHHFVLISTNDSTLIRGANCDATYGGPEIGFWHDGCRTLVTETNEAEAATRFRREGLAYAREHPRQLLTRVIPVRILRTWDLWHPSQLWPLAEGQHRSVAKAGTIAYYLLLPFAAIGLRSLRRRNTAVWLLLVPALTTTVVSVVGYGYPRFRHEADLVIVVLAAAGLLAVADRLRSGEDRRAATSRPTTASR